MKKEYKVIIAWGRMMGSNGGYIASQVAKAERDGAPFNATYERDGKWNTLDNITSIDTLRALATILTR